MSAQLQVGSSELTHGEQFRVNACMGVQPRHYTVGTSRFSGTSRFKSKWSTDPPTVSTDVLTSASKPGDKMISLHM